MTTARVLAPYFAPAVNGGGPIRTLAALVDAAPADLRLDVVTRDRDLGASDRLPVPDGEVVAGRRRVRYLDVRGAAGTSRLVRELRSDAAPEIDYLNSVFDPHFAVLPTLLHRTGRIASRHLVIAPRGEFDPGALALKSAKKTAFLVAARHAGLFDRVCWHASTDIEADHITRVVGLGSRVVVRENETSLPLTASSTPVPRSPRLELVTVGRISAKKRLHVLIEALAAVRNSVRLRVVGPVDDARYAARCRALASTLPAHAEVAFCGPLEHDEVLRTVAGAHATATATAGENFGHTIAESLSAARPVLLPDTTPWTERVRHGGGTIVADGSWSAVIDRWASMPHDEHVRRSRAAGAAYRTWRATAGGPHVFELVLGR
jgi:glycosyltransferase involved in cell wall biosynthesis